jgi:hypothetical protein
MKKASEYRYLEAFKLSIGRCERIRTFDPLHPMQVRYQAAPHTELARDYNPPCWLSRLRRCSASHVFQTIHGANA